MRDDCQEGEALSGDRGHRGRSLTDRGLSRAPFGEQEQQQGKKPDAEMTDEGS
jgi:hypothetical protein